MASLLKKGLEEENHSVPLASDGPEALKLAQNYDFDVIMLDIMLPGIDGFEVARRLPVPQSRDELQQLSETLNGMLERLEAAFRRITQFTVLPMSCARLSP